MSKAGERKWGMSGGRERGRMARGASKAPSSSPDMWCSLTRPLRGVVTLALFLVAAVVDGPGAVTAQETDDMGFEARTYNGTNNNLDYPLWGSVNISQVRFLIVLLPVNPCFRLVLFVSAERHCGTSFLAGVRYTQLPGHSKWRPFLPCGTGLYFGKVVSSNID